VSVTQIRAGDTWNVLPDECILRGTARWFDDDVGQLLERRVTQLAEGIAEGFGCRASVQYERRFPATINDHEAAASMRSLARAAPLGFDVCDAQPSMSSEDFAFMLQAVPGCYVWLGSGRGSCEHGLHSSRYDFNDDLLPRAAALWASLVRQALTGS
jgi:hippurate hydrolase